jgi:ribonuclease HI
MVENKEVYFHGSVPYKGAQMAIGAVLVDGTEIIDEIGGVVPYAGSQSRAHWEALLQGMELAARHNIRRLIMKGDSRSVVNYMNGQSPDRDFDSMDYLLKARKEQLKFDQCFFQWIPLEKNSRAVKLIMESME